ncbi:hypothetical protein M2139_001025 [Enterococcus sp. PF1-24]|uniref:hypothetical protein n=1 Tax=unclassified Enterococcus TaxID=2608891 RepID=UPI002475F404|nr:MULTISPECIES: hypothetical protein [unclassified Enterococcus]MDH6364040.1 hypothetical protein [Enterococcus sp. PFB1-1]MDH6401141.1 hypothetical protein [Enterococcus sp. PF1-24]
MNKKKSIGLVAVSSAALLLTGCGKSAQETAVNFIAEQGDYNINNVSTQEITFEKLELEMEEPDPQTQMILSQVKDAKLSFVTTTDLENDVMSAEAKLKVLGTSIPFDMYFEEDAMYFSMDTFAKAVSLFETFSGVEDDELNFMAEETAGKFMTLTQKEMAELYEEGDFDEILTNGKLLDFDEMDEGILASSALLADYTATLPKDSFKKDGDKITHTYTKEEIIDFVAYLEENGTETIQDTLKDLEFEDMLKDLEDELNELDFSMDLVVDTKANSATYFYNILLEDDETSLEAQVKLVSTGSKEDVDVKVPAKKKRITLDDLDKLEAEYDEKYGYDAYDYDTYEMTDKELEEELAYWKEDDEYYMTAEEFIEFYYDADFTDAQKKRIEEFFPE